MPDKKDNKTNKKSNNRPLRGLTIAVTIFTLLLVSSLILVYLVSQRIDSMSGADSQIRLSAQGGFSCEYSEAQKLYPYGEGVIKVTNERIAYLTLSGNEIYSSMISYQNPQCVVFGSYAAVFDRDGYNFTLLNEKNVIYSKPVQNQIKSLNVSSKGYTAVITDSKESYGEVLLYDDKGTSLSEWSSYNSGFPVCCCFDDKSEHLAVSTVNSGGAVVVPYVRVFTITSDKKGIEVADSSIYESDDNVIIASMKYIRDRLYCFASGAMYEVRNDKLSRINYDFTSIGYINSVNGNFFITYSDGVSQLCKLAILNGSDSVIYNSDIGTKIFAVSSNDRLYAVNADRRIFIYDSSGVVINDFSVDEEIIRMNFISGNKLCVVSAGGVHTIN